MGDGESASPVTQPETPMGDGEGGRRGCGRRRWEHRSRERGQDLGLLGRWPAHGRVLPAWLTPSCQRGERDVRPGCLAEDGGKTDDAGSSALPPWESRPGIV
jgi:hypothetical protein